MSNLKLPLVVRRVVCDCRCASHGPCQWYTSDFSLVPKKMPGTKWSSIFSRTWSESCYNDPALSTTKSAGHLAMQESSGWSDTLFCFQFFSVFFMMPLNLLMECSALTFDAVTATWPFVGVVFDHLELQSTLSRCSLIASPNHS